MIHQVKCEHQFFEDVIRGNKLFEIRKNDRNYQVGDYLAMNELTEDKTEYTRRSAMFVIDYVMDSEKSNFTIAYNYVVLGLRPCTVINTDKRGCDVLTGKERKI